MPDIKDQKLLYHLTSLNNIGSILKNGLKPRSSLTNFDDIADAEIIASRRAFNLDAHVPFHWFSRNPFDGRVQKDRPDEKFVLVTVRRALARSRNWKIIPRHPLANADVALHDYQEGFTLIDWERMNKRDYHDADCKNICMAECLSPDVVEVSRFFMIYVPTEDIFDTVESDVKRLGLSVKVCVNGAMFN